LELIAAGNPALLRAGDEFAVTLLYRNKPLKGALVTAIARRDGQRVSVRSDATGRARFTLTGDGGWLIKSVHMTAAPAAAGVDWVSYWASLTFEVSAATAPARGTR
jgi:uncharacterized GH25 family protein